MGKHSVRKLANSDHIMTDVGRDLGGPLNPLHAEGYLPTYRPGLDPTFCFWRSDFIIYLFMFQQHLKGRRCER
jgi:hypothetical protein